MATRTPLPPSEIRLKKLLKEAFVEVLKERKDLVRDALAEAAEDLGMINAMRQGERTPLVSRSEVFRGLRKRS
jgi:hypothetical protein